MVGRLLLFLILTVFSSLAGANTLKAQVDRTEIGLGESVQLSVILSGANGQQPDLRGLSKDFSIEQSSQSSSISVVNGSVSQQTHWTFLLTPNHKGTLTIPALSVNGLSTDPINIVVGDEPVAQSSSDDVWMEVEVRPLHPYVDGQVIYIQRLYYSRPLVDHASISQPKITQGQVDIVFIGSSNPRYVKKNGRPYQLIERYYAVFPKQPGVLQFAPSVFRGSLASHQSRRDRFAMPAFPARTRVSAYSPKAELHIEDKPASFRGTHWLPASKVSLQMNWSQPPDTLQAGEPVTVTIALMAEGVKAETLPEVKLALPDTLKIYPEKPGFRSDKGEYGIVGLREERFTLLINKGGEYQIPAVEVPWWNTNTNKQEVARLDAFTIKVSGTVAGASAGSQAGISPDKPEVKSDTSADRETSSKQTKPQSDVHADEIVDPVMSSGMRGYYQENKLWIWPVLLVFIALLGWAGFSRRRSIKEPESQEALGEQRKQAATQALSTACNENNAQAALKALPEWAAAVGIYPATLVGVEQCGNPALAEAVRELSCASYSLQPQPWHGEALLQAMTQYTVNQTGHQSAVGLSPLHPIS
ncbi:MAG: hypothetical protein CSB48_00615 [Proteobacteria bacterium]|nr:MAG: hypothetical protein CSB48_00615 [Pseudomonadota bacterium]